LLSSKKQQCLPKDLASSPISVKNPEVVTFTLSLFSYFYFSLFIFPIPIWFSDLDSVSDILTKDYNSDQKLTISSSTNSGLVSNYFSTISITPSLVAIVNLLLLIIFQDLNSTLLKSRGLSSGDAVAQFKHDNKTLHFKVDTDSTVSSL